MKLRLRLWEAGEVSELISKILGQQNSGPLRARKRVMQPQTDEQRGKRACALTARGSISKAMQGLVGGAAQGSVDFRKNWTTALIPRSSGGGTHPTIAKCAEAARVAWDRVALSRHTGDHECSGPHRRTTGTFGCHRLFRRTQPEETLVSRTRHSHN